MPLLLAGLFLAAGCGPQAEEERPERPDDVDVRPDVIFSTADDRPLHIYIESQGVVEANREVVIRPRLSGFVERTLLEDGRFVERGDTLLAFLDDEWRYQLRQAENELESAMVDYDIERRQRGSRNAAGGQGEPANDRMLRNITGVAQAELDLERAEMDLTFAVTTAPFSGVVSVPEQVSPGEYLSSGTELGRLIDDRTVRVRLDVLESELSKLDRGMSVRIIAPDGEVRQGTIRSLSPVVDPESKTGQVIVEAGNANRRLRPGMTVEGRVQIRTHSGQARVPRAAILERDGGRTLVFKLNGQAVEWVYVEPEYMTSEWAIVNHEEIAPGDTLAVDRHFALSHLQQVRPRMAGEIVREDVGEL